MDAELASLSTTIAEKIHLDVVFQRLDDRIGHTLALRGPSLRLPLLSSVEGGGDEGWPASPPLQQLSVEVHDAGRTALLVGMAGRSHWSLCIVEDSDPPGLLFDVACRVSETPLWLGSGYQALVAIQPAGPAAVLLEAGPVPVRVALEAIGQEPEAAIVREDTRLTMEAARDDRGLPATFRWKYRISAGK